MSDFDVIFFGDFRTENDAMVRVVEEVLMNAGIGHRSGLAHVPSTEDCEPFIRAEVLELIDDSRAVALDYSMAATTRLAIVFDPTAMLATRPKLPVRIVAERVLAVLHLPAASDLIALSSERLVQLFGEVVSWTATTYDALALLRQSGAPTLGTVWPPFGSVRAAPGRPYLRKDARPLIGAVCGPGAEHWPTDPDALKRIWDHEQYRVRVMGEPPLHPIRGWDILRPGGRSPVRFAGGLDALLYYPHGRPADMPLTAIGACLAADIPVFLPPHLKVAIGKGPNYVAIEDVARALRIEFTGTQRLSTPRFNAIEAHRRRMGFWLKSPPRVPLRRQRTALFVSSNGDGLGHVTRLLGIARKLPPDVTPVFATLSLGIGIIRDAGYHAELILSHRYAGLDVRKAYPWMSAELDEMLSRHAPDVVVFDGGNPYGFLLESVAARRRQAFLWIRRAMWKKEQDNASVLEKEMFFDAVIEPSDLAESRDNGATVTRREGVVVVDPIRLLEEDEQLTRRDARTALGLHPEGLAVLIQLGPGNQRDVSNTLAQVLSAFDGMPDVQLVNLNAPISRHPPSHSARLKQASVYPMARYLQAFDFALSAAGYNSFHELLAGQVPTIFVVTPRPELDDQEGRAAYAEAMGLGYALNDGNLVGLPDLVERLASDSALRETIRRNCGRLQRTNGARQAADLIGAFAR